MSIDDTVTGAARRRVAAPGPARPRTDTDPVRCIECGMPGEVVDRFVLRSTDGPIAHVRTTCVLGHCLVVALS